MEKEHSTNLIWRQTRLAWIAALPSDADDRGQPVTGEIALPVRALCRRLLKLGGTHVCVPFGDPDIRRLLGRGKLFLPDSIQFQPGETSRCHVNSAHLWKQNRKAYRIATGYALTESDGMWRQHSWLLHKQGSIVETTEPRSMYYGIALNILEAFWFSVSNED